MRSKATEGIFRVLVRNQASSTFRQCTVWTLFAQDSLRHGFGDILKHSGCKEPNSQTHEQLGLCQLDPFLPAAPCFWDKAGALGLPPPARQVPLQPIRPFPLNKITVCVAWCPHTPLGNPALSQTQGAPDLGGFPPIRLQTLTWGLLTETQV